MESLSLEEEKIIKNIRNIFRIVKETKAIKDRILGEIKNLFKSVRVSSFWSNSYIEYESNSDRNEVQSVEEYLNKLRSYLNDIINNLKKSDKQTINNKQ